MRDEMMTLRGEIVAVDDEIVAAYNVTILPRAAVFPSRERPAHAPRWTVVPRNHAMRPKL